MKHKTEVKFHSTAAFVKNIEASKKFYTEILEQMIELDFGKNVILKGGITLWEINPNHIILKKLVLRPSNKVCQVFLPIGLTATVAWEHSRNENKAGIDWRFTTADARIKLKKLYPTL